MPIGPTLPPHLLAKRKHTDGEEDEEDKTNNASSRSSSPDEGSKRRRVAGPAAPPAPIEQRPAQGPEQDADSSSSEDEYGPVLPSKDSNQTSSASVFDSVPVASTQEEHKPKRDDWMMLPPKQDGLAARMDPTKIRPGKFKSGKGAAAGGGEMSSEWMETPEEKQKRLRDEVLGIAPATSQQAKTDDLKARRRQAEEEEKARRIREQMKGKNNTKSLYEQHKTSAKTKDDDDPSKRAFDYEKDMGGGSQVMSHAKKREMLNKAADFGSKFSKPTYL